ncbi:MAG TPA: GFA family protein [Dongiaceae bacterium]|jgi:hypothetical protein
MANKIKGGCLCGQASYEIAADPIMAVHCHCTDCQKTSGSGHTEHVLFPRAAVKLTGKLSEYKSKADSGNTVTRAFCPTCGSPVFSASSGMPDMLTVRAGTLEDPAKFQAQATVYAIRRHKWDPMDASIPSFDRMPPMRA